MINEEEFIKMLKEFSKVNPEVRKILEEKGLL